MSFSCGRRSTPQTSPLRQSCAPRRSATLYIRARRASRELLILIHWDGFNIAQAARVMGLNQSSARTRYSRAKQRLTTQLEHLGPPEPGATHVPHATRGV
ncbi:sigma factor-like helix-turn-helix DNA-binding protein [Microbacterium sp. LWH3-1.2]|uniref:sigma factor-like helix-turn-helix DNA-binding protein n=1 Tax=Microbacterium sp. LWH3-1.2 TaxID=3135256 RepID=UPI0034381D05